jgi:biopolymer transport protein ExbB/TolQ
MFDFLAKGGVLVGPILLCSVIALALFLERLVRLEPDQPYAVTAWYPVFPHILKMVKITRRMR